MRAFKYFLIVALASMSYIICSAETIWSDRGFPQMKIAITAAASRGDNIYAGTNQNGFFYTYDNGREWKTVDKTFDNISIKHIITTGKSSVIAFSEQEIFKSDDDGNRWSKIDFFKGNDETIQCYCISKSEIIYVGTNKNIWMSEDNTSTWQLITNNLSTIVPDVIAIACNSFGEIFISIQNGDRGAMYLLSELSGKWNAKQNGISGSYKTDKLLCNRENIFYAVFGNDLYSYDNDILKWSLIEIPVKDHFISKINVTQYGDLIVSQDEKISIWDHIAEEWIYDEPDIDMPNENGNLEISNDGFGLLFYSNKLLKSKITINDKIKDINFIYSITLYDVNNISIPNKTFDLIKNGLNIGQVTTNEMGKFTTSGFSIASGDEIKLSRMFGSIPAVKPSRNIQGNNMALVMIDNAKIDENGKQTDFKLGGNFYPDIIMDHTTLKFNLVVSLNWDASQTYLDSLKTWMKYLANYYYDVSDGQMCFHQIDIYDNKVMWDESDVKIFASNMVWPNANIHCIYETDGHAHMPRKWYGGSDDTRNITAESNWMEVLNHYNYRTLGHELGHYLYGFLDEYLYTDDDLKKKLPYGYNYGYMQYQYHGGYSSEMSSMAKYPYSDYKITYQYVYNGSDCWTQFETEYEKKYGGVNCNIFKPSERFLGSRDYLKGPNSNIWNLDYDVGSEIVFQIHNVDNNAGEVNLIVKVEGQNVGNLPMMLFKKSGSTYKRLDQGVSADNSKIKILGANVGDFVAINYYKYGPAEVWSLTHDIIIVSEPKSGDKDDKILSDEVSLKKVDGNYMLDNQFAFDEGGELMLSAKPNIKFGDKPKLQIELDERGIQQLDLPYDDKDQTYNFTFENRITEGIFDIFAYDKSKQPFYIPFNYRMSERIDVCYSYNGDALLNMDLTNNDKIMKLLIASTQFHVPLNGLPEGSERASDIFYISSYPYDINEKSNNQLALYYSPLKLSESKYNDLGIFKWEDNGRTWILIGGVMDTTMQVVYADINSGGCYGLFTYEKPNSVPNIHDRGSLKMKVSPNPADDIATLDFCLEKAGITNISLTNSLGIEIDIIANAQYLTQGKQRFDISTSNLPSGVYYVTVKAGFKVETIGFIVVR